MKKISFISILVFILDRITKILITNNFKLNVKNKIIKNFLYITNCHNKGAAFSLFNGNVIFLVLVTLIVLYIIYNSIRNYKILNLLTTISYGLLLGGILGNLFDRLFYGYVIDFLDFIIFKYDFPIFNIADIAIVFGAFMLLFFEGSEVDERTNNISN